MCICEAHWELDNGRKVSSAHWERSFGTRDCSKHLEEIVALAKDRKCLLGSTGCGKGYGRGHAAHPRSRKELKDLVRSTDVLVVDGLARCCEPDRIALAVLGEPSAVEDFLETALARFERTTREEQMHVDIAELKRHMSLLQQQLATITEQFHRVQAGPPADAPMPSGYSSDIHVGAHVEVWWKGGWWPAVVTEIRSGRKYFLRDLHWRWHSWVALQDNLRRSR
eukprot:gnl/TRDRNA2_/TRDRNA2_147121_c0_seq1.p1 gnl/TRDRNA2_/TRDRNA2_147121_c0~~gnl/TRDRNA2_/TRDRNA2_147121_c0_seq1.p1  ORF type:complete len:224 (+),score=30.16 gnl/TRDRNA2_/TRDRNA2_147121_c0_seq1:3-674(+)